MEWMILPLKRYFDFSGRSRRKEYWMFLLFTVLANIVLGTLDSLLGLNFGEDEGVRDNGILTSIFSLVTFVPSISVAVRRLHDTDRTGWWLLFPLLAIFALIIAFAPSVGFSERDFQPGPGFMNALGVGALSFLVPIVFFCLDGTRGPNRFGEDPKGVAFDGVFD